MRIKAFMIFVIALAGVASAQQGVPDGLPWPRGVYLRAGGDWVGIQPNPLMPMVEGLGSWVQTPVS